MVTKHKLNLELSKKVYERCKSMIEIKQCYANVFYTIHHFTNKFETGEWKIAYGYIRALKDSNLMARHCFIVNEENEAIDPTLLTLTFFKEQDEKDYCSFHIFDSLDEYLDAVLDYDNRPDLVKPLMKIEKETSEVWAKDNQLILIR